MHNLTLGTVQLGVDYGVANSVGRPAFETAKEIVRTALEGGIEWLDTAVVYGDSEAVIGRCLRELDQDLTKNVKIITKLPSLKGCSEAEIDCLLEESLKKLNCDQIQGLMLHSAQDLLEVDRAKLDHFFNYRESGKVKQVGVSVYTVEQAKYAINNFEVDIIQFQSNLLDRSFLDGGIFDLCAEKGIQVFVRSIFLQGLFFLSADDPKIKGVKGAAEALCVLHTFCSEYGCSVPELCFADVSRFKNASIIIGAEQPSQVVENLKNASQSENLLHLLDEWDIRRPSVTNELTNPVLWNT